MSQASNDFEGKLLNHVFGKSSYTAPTIYVALCTAGPSDTSTGSTITEANYTGYARKSTAASDWNSASSGTTTNANALEFDACTSGTSDVTHFALVDASSAGNVLCYGALDATLSVSAGITPRIAASALEISID